MYTACLFWHRDLGRNEGIAAFPVGRRLAFDARKGRLWVVCATCERWNLTPLEERWEAIEQCEQRFRGTRLRVSTDNVALARLPEGLELVRIGAALRPEIAAWRYGDQFGRRRRRQLAVTGGVVVGLGAAVVGGAAAGATALLLSGVFEIGSWLAIRGNPEAVVARVPGGASDRVLLRRRDLDGVRVWGDGHRLHVHLRRGDVAYEHSGELAARVVALLLPHVNRFGARRDEVRDAVRAIEGAGDAVSYLARFRRQGREDGRSGPPDRFTRDADHYGLRALPRAERLALEMAVHEAQERRALHGELAELERAWQEAEEIAAIADGLVEPPGIAESLARLRAADLGEAAAS